MARHSRSRDPGGATAWRVFQRPAYKHKEETVLERDIWERIDELFDAALDLPHEARARWLDAVCADDPAARRQVERLLALTETDDPRLDPKTIETLVKLLSLEKATTDDG